LLETERLLHESLVENDRLKAFEKQALARIQAAESKHKSAEAGLMTAKRQVVELKAKLDREYKTSSQLRVEVGELKDAVNVAREGAQKAEEEAQAYYDQGFDEAATSLKSQLANECNKHFLQG
jgi:chromosome segregation ATPase